MPICLNCGVPCADWLCEACRPKTDLERLCGEIISYRFDSGENPIFETAAQEFENPYQLRGIAAILAGGLPSPRREYIQFWAELGASANVVKAKRPWFYEIYLAIRARPELTDDERIRLDGVALGAYFMDYEFAEADQIAEELSCKEELPWQAVFNLSEFYTKTRRYDTSEALLLSALDRFSDNAFVSKQMMNHLEENVAYREKAEAGKQEYLPRPKENGDEIRRKYVDFLASVGIDAVCPQRVPKPLPRETYPTPTIRRDAGFDSFVAFDVETTGLSRQIDSIVEIGAVKVVGGKLVESSQFLFQELVHPLDYKKLSPQIEQLTGITNEEVYAARPIWEVFPDFMRFAGDNILVGYNCAAFDSYFFVRAGRYSNIVIRNEYFDVMHYAKRQLPKLNCSMENVKLNTLAEQLSIQNPQAHRALADAITTARVFLKLKAMK